MEFLPQIIFILLLGGFGYLIYKRFAGISRNIRLGKPFRTEGKPWDRTKRMLLFAFGQKKMFDKPLVGGLHFLIYAGFVLINIEVLEIILDGILGTHRLFLPVLGGFYPILIGFFEILALGVLLSCVVFLIRRNILKVGRFQNIEMKGWPTLDGNLILVIEIVLMVAILYMNAADQVLQSRSAGHYPQSGSFLISSMLAPGLTGFDSSTLIFLERGFWWVHIIGILAFAVYVTYSKHLHIFLAFPNTFFSKGTPKGKARNMSAVTKEVKIMLGMEQDSGGEPPAPGSFGAKDVMDLSWKNLLEAYTCTECGRCTSECPANQTGKKLSPRKIMMATRDRMEEVGGIIDKEGEFKEDGKSLLRDHVSEEELLACTSCNACVEACPVLLNPLDIIIEMRRYLVMEESKSPQEWTSMMSNIENNFAPWAFSAADRFNWAEDRSKE